MNPRTLCACQPVAFMISTSVAPFARPIISRMVAPLPCLGRPSFCATFLAALLDFARAAFFAALAVLFFRLEVASSFECGRQTTGRAPDSAEQAVAVCSGRQRCKRPARLIVDRKMGT